MHEAANVQRLLQQHFTAYSHSHKLDGQRLKVCRHLLSCHTPALGGVQYQCDHCKGQVPRYHSCRDRHCPQCQQRASRRWSERQQQSVLPVTYYHLVFTLPHELNGWVQLHPEVIYALLFKVAWQTLKTFAADPKRLGGRLGMTAVLHTWGQNLSQHVHLHCLIPGGALTINNEWHAAKSTYLFPVRALSRHFRGNMVSALRDAADADKLSRVIRVSEVDKVLNQLMQKDWVVFSKPCINHTETIVNYLARYSHRIAISDQRLIRMDKDGVCFRYKDYRKNQYRTLTLSCEEFIRRFMMHVLPKGLMRLRHYGLLANRCRQASLETIRRNLTCTAKVEEALETCDATRLPCPKCQQGNLFPAYLLTPVTTCYSYAPG